ncbi:MAG: serine--tRNA ligase [Candidatus Diapherotrites archaeon]|uniref:Serine--tRNA ligase n=1 Tax=Candidatus Iainarchaeum sp. TaxID=3101447 RepID=A0A938YX25_9ARCH|nr:serine--tRNA ligase [Candidatus Diapherotrites archaeon]
MLDINFLREDPSLVEKDLKKRNAPEKLKWLDDLLKKDREWRALKLDIDKLRQRRNELSRQVDSLRKEGKDTSALLRGAKQVPGLIGEKEEQAQKLKEKVDVYLMRLPNILHESVPPGKSDEDNVVVRKHGRAVKPAFEVKHHGQLAADLGIADFERAVKISGAGFFILKGSLALLDIALQRLAIDLLLKKGFTLIQPPFMIRRAPYEGVVDLDDFENVMYKIEGEDQYLIATSEHPMGSMYMGEILEESQLPMKLAGVSACFRKEIGKHGLDERGFFRVHQFNKIEQFVFCRPEQSWKLHEELVKNAEELLKKLEIPYNVTNVCTGDIGAVAAKKYDVNGWSPREQKYIELMSCSNCTGYQAARLGIKYRKKSGEKELAHTLNSTMVATTRTLRCIIENCQTKKGTIKVPKALQKHMNGLKEIKQEK